MSHAEDFFIKLKLFIPCDCPDSPPPKWQATLSRNPPNCVPDPLPMAFEINLNTVAISQVAPQGGGVHLSHVRGGKQHGIAALQVNASGGMTSQYWGNHLALTPEDTVRYQVYTTEGKLLAEGKVAVQNA